MNISMENVEVLGLIAGILSTISFFPQALKAWKTNSTKELSLCMYIIYSLSLILWGIYAWYIQAISLLVTEIVTSIFVLYILQKKMRES